MKLVVVGVPKAPHHRTHSRMAVFLAVGLKLDSTKPSIHAGYSLICDSYWRDQFSQ